MLKNYLMKYQNQKILHILINNYILMVNPTSFKENSIGDLFV